MVRKKEWWAVVGIASSLVEDAFSCDTDSRMELTGCRKDCYFIPGQQLDQLLFAVYHSQRLCEEVKAAYYAALSYDP